MRTLGYIGLGFVLYWIYSNPDEFLDNVARAVSAVRAGVKSASDEYDAKHPRKKTDELDSKIEVESPEPSTESGTGSRFRVLDPYANEDK